MGYSCYIPSGYVKIAIEDGPVEIVSFPINSGFPVRYVSVHQRVDTLSHDYLVGGLEHFVFSIYWE